MASRVILASFLAIAIPSMTGCGMSNLQPMTKSQLEAHMAKQLDLRDVHLDDQGDGRFTGSGKSSDGRIVVLDVTQRPGHLSWKHPLSFTHPLSDDTGLGRLDKEGLEKHTAQRLQLTDVKLTDEGSGRFTGTGKDAEGQEVRLEVKQDTRRLSWKFSRKKTTDGSVSEGEQSVGW